MKEMRMFENKQKNKDTRLKQLFQNSSKASKVALLCTVVNSSCLFHALHK